MVQGPDWCGGVNLDWTPPTRLQFRAEYLHLESAFGSAIPTGEQMLRAYHRLDLKAFWSAHPKLRIWLCAQFLTDAYFFIGVLDDRPNVTLL